MIKTFAVLALFLAGCSGSQDFACNKDGWSGTYVLAFEERARGTCGQLPDIVILFAAGQAGKVPNGCEQKTSVSTDSCLRTVSWTCSTENIVMTLTQQDEKAKELTGLYTYSQTRGCASTYDIVATRQ